jgi:hypothetical protein
MDLAAFATICVTNHIAMTEFIEHDGRHILLIRLTDANITDGNFDDLLSRMALFFKLVKRVGIRYHFVIDLHTIENIPYMRLVEIQTYLATQRERLLVHLHNTIIVTQSDAMKKVVDVSMSTIYTPSRPFMCVVAKPPQTMHPTLKVPVCVADEVSAFLMRHLNTEPMPPPRAPRECESAPAKKIDVSSLPRLQG